jgi:hypothetical protein
MSIKVIEGLEPWQVMQAAIDGERVAYRDSSEAWMELKDTSIKHLCCVVAEGWSIAIIDDSQSEIGWRKFYYDFFKQYGGLSVRFGQFETGKLLAAEPAEEAEHCELEPSPFYPWFGGECPVPGNCEVGYTLRNGVTSTIGADEIEWAHDGLMNGYDVIVFRLTGRVL